MKFSFLPMVLVLISSFGSTFANEPTSGIKITTKEARTLRRNFIDLLDAERDRLRSEQKRTLKDGDAGRKARRKEWDTNEKVARRKFFDEKTHGPERREYIREFNNRRKALYEQLRNEEREMKNEAESHWKSLKNSQKDRLERLEEYLKKLERPPSRLLERVY